MVDLTPPPAVTAPWLQSTATDSGDGSVAALALAEEISVALKRLKVVIGFLTVCIAAGDQVCGVIASGGPDQEDRSPWPQTKALQALFTVILAIVFHRNHREVEYRLQLSKIDLVIADVLQTL